MRLLFYTDLHAKDQNPRSRTGSYRDDVLKKLHEIVHLAQEYKVDYLVNGADTFDNKSAWRTSHLLVQEMIAILDAFPGEKHLTVVGTHDVPTGQLEKVYQQPLGVLARAGVISILGFSPNNIRFFDDATFHGVHASYDLDKDPTNYAFSFLNNPGSRPVITVAHGMIVPPGCTFFGDYTDVDRIHTDADVVLYGHPHTPDGIYKNSDGTIFVGPGSVSRLGSYPYNRKRIPEVVLMEWEPEGSWKFKSIKLESARPPEEVFAEVIQEEEDENALTERVENFIHSLQSANISDDSWGIEDLLKELRSLPADDKVKQYAEEILTQVS